MSASFLFNLVDRKQMFFKNSPMSGFEPRNSGVRAITQPTDPQTLPFVIILEFLPKKCPI